MVADEGRFGRLGQVMRAWSAPGVRPSSPQQLTREYVYAYAAVAPSLGALSALILPASNTDMMTLFLDQVSQEFLNYFIVMQVDGASYHRSQDLDIPENIRLIIQPPRSPELNSAEHIWEEIREKHFYNRAFDSLDAVEDVLAHALKSLMEMPDKVRKMTFFPHLRLTL
jgi:transposase